MKECFEAMDAIRTELQAMRLHERHLMEPKFNEDLLASGKEPSTELVSTRAVQGWYRGSTGAVQGWYSGGTGAVQGRRWHGPWELGQGAMTKSRRAVR